jgi:hypothetical protein
LNIRTKTQKAGWGRDHNNNGIQPHHKPGVVHQEPHNTRGCTYAMKVSTEGLPKGWRRCGPRGELTPKEAAVKMDHVVKLERSRP